MIDPGRAFRLDGRVALVTGATRGIGRAIAEAYVAAGAGVCVLARKADELEETAAALGTIGGPVATYAGSAGDPDAIDAAVTRCVEELGGLDILVNNAATNPTFGPMIETEARAVRKVLEVNVEGPLLLARARMARVDARARRGDRQRRVGGRPQARAVHRHLQRLEGRAPGHDATARDRAGAVGARATRSCPGS